MSVFTEGSLQIAFPATAKVRKFDDQSHGLSHCMKAVDFVAELDDRYYFIEFKDPCRGELGHSEAEKYLKGFLAGSIDEELKYKYRDSFLYEWASGRAEKPVYYLVLIAVENLGAADMLVRTDELKRKLPCAVPPYIEWKRPIIAGCAVFNIAEWNRRLAALFPVSRKA